MVERQMNMTKKQPFDYEQDDIEHETTLELDGYSNVVGVSEHKHM